MTSTEPDDGLWARRFHPTETAHAKLICLPHAGGSASFFFPVSRALSPDIDVVAIQYPGRQDRRREPFVDNLTELAQKIFDVLSPWDTSLPVALFGHSMGASLGFELARLMERKAGVVPAHLFASGRRAPSRHRHETVHLRDDKGLLADVQTLNGTDARVFGDDEMLQMMLPAIRADYRAAETYTYQPGEPLHCPITAFTGDNDPKVTIDEARSWAEHTTGAFDLTVFPGGHFFLATQQPKILATITERLVPAA